ncbi:hypothetical protein H105_01157 [Trichophyton soudanense CBS 452.61]|uniref:Uncharacterized protein n=1 Tax=Trichophyton soudanense CBS 452.61 TaxID=1215331 RepID=A0A022Y4H7_TRISD|nr:hypothetical protein H105_01157 [Trichophyton soudanense CBS 452.61]
MHGGRGKGENTGSSGNPGKVNKRRGMLYPSLSTGSPSPSTHPVSNVVRGKEDKLPQMLVLPAKLGHLGIFFLFPNSNLLGRAYRGSKLVNHGPGGKRREYCSFPGVGSYTLIIPTAESPACVRVVNDKHPLSWPSIPSASCGLMNTRRRKYCSPHTPFRVADSLIVAYIS